MLASTKTNIALTRKKAIKMSAAFVLLMAAAIFCSANAFAASYESGHERHTVGGRVYEAYSILYLSTQSRGSVWVNTANLSNVPAGYMGVSAGLYTSSGDVLAETSMNYNSSADNFYHQLTSYVRTSETVYSTGQVSLYNGTRYETFDAPETVRVSNRAASALMDTLVNGNYPTNTYGSTYGSALLSQVVGSKPDLISAIGVDGTKGYVKATELYPDIATPEEAVAYMNSRETEFLIPLYDVDENVIGSFLVSAPDEEANDEGQAQRDKLRLAAAKAAAAEDSQTIHVTQAQVDEAKQPLLASLVNGSYPVNSKGETYGSRLLARVVGFEPDLVSAIGTEGEHGYVRIEDLRGPVIRTPEEAVAYTLSLPDGPRMIPLYDVEGGVIGSFAIAHS